MRKIFNFFGRALIALGQAVFVSASSPSACILGHRPAGWADFIEATKPGEDGEDGDGGNGRGGIKRPGPGPKPLPVGPTGDYDDALRQLVESQQVPA